MHQHKHLSNISCISENYCTNPRLLKVVVSVNRPVVVFSNDPFSTELWVTLFAFMTSVKVKTKKEREGVRKHWYMNPSAHSCLPEPNAFSVHRDSSRAANQSLLAIEQLSVLRDIGGLWTSDPSNPLPLPLKITHGNT